MEIKFYVVEKEDGTYLSSSGRFTKSLYWATYYKRRADADKKASAHEGCRILTFKATSED